MARRAIEDQVYYGATLAAIERRLIGYLDQATAERLILKDSDFTAKERMSEIQFYLSTLNVIANMLDGDA